MTSKADLGEGLWAQKKSPSKHKDQSKNQARAGTPTVKKSPEEKVARAEAEASRCRDLQTPRHTPVRENSLDLARDFRASLIISERLDAGCKMQAEAIVNVSDSMQADILPIIRAIAHGATTRSKNLTSNFRTPTARRRKKIDAMERGYTGVKESFKKTIERRKNMKDATAGRLREFVLQHGAGLDFLTGADLYTGQATTFL
ncbi:MAG: hypothetical protein L6R37_006489 [Teloschistes peruensis]|nr:MAG: hypothetical protein L6R37_006489 [Teloschistes peruensis]